ncbi:tetratricopeptide repeat protein [Litoribacter alkaliphilus]|uniref:Tetratricopeptide repeat protein n=1 Tax=Litoribacter ruber TaxID=702568 RepID=A0AAP2CHH7_9BACT|nr:tetratricopeptide repeat protein [Litoribacter alkaliphilus]MBS9523331.1 tetratricopeptide repeat protein [Litoribacter alkaliphilus]
MKKSQIIVLTAGVALVAGLYTLPRVVVDNAEEGQSVENTAAAEAPVAEDMHNPNAKAVDYDQVAELRSKMEVEENKENFAIFADSIGSLYASSGKYDSAAYYYAQAADKVPAPARWEKAGNAYYEAYGFAMNQEKINTLAGKTQDYLNKVLEQHPERLDLKTKVAMTYVTSENPMQAIGMLREILEQDPQNGSALFNMGVLSMQSGQYKRAAERFEDLVSYHPEHIQGQFYLGVSYFESKQKNKAKKQFELVKSMTQDSMILNSVENYLDRI